MEEPPRLEDYRYRLRGVHLPTQKAVDRIRKQERKYRSSLLLKVKRTLFLYWHSFSSEHFQNVTNSEDDELMYMIFLHCYAQFLWLFKRERKSKDGSTRYWCGVRVRIWDKTLHCWKSISKSYAHVDDEDFYDQFALLTFELGMLCREMEMLYNNQLNAPEYFIHHQESRRKGADAIHQENRACKADAFAWLDANFSTCKSMDAAAEVMAGKIVPQKFRAVRDWVREWKKLRSASTP